MYPAAEVSSWAQLNEVLSSPGSPVRPETIFLKNDIARPSTAPLNISRPITLKGGYEISTGGYVGDLFSISAGSLTIDGPALRGHGANTGALVYVSGGGFSTSQAGGLPVTVP
jgi:hypothetical protein